MPMALRLLTNTCVIVSLIRTQMLGCLLCGPCTVYCHCLPRFVQQIHIVPIGTSYHHRYQDPLPIGQHAPQNYHYTSRRASPDADDARVHTIQLLSGSQYLAVARGWAEPDGDCFRPFSPGAPVHTIHCPRPAVTGRPEVEHVDFLPGPANPMIALTWNAIEIAECALGIRFVQTPSGAKGLHPQSLQNSEQYSRKGTAYATGPLTP